MALILLLQGIWSGFRVQVSAYEDNTGADLLVGEAGTQNFLGVPSVLPMEAVSDIGALPGVERVDPVAARFAVLDLHERKQSTFLIGAIPGAMGGPWDIAEGRGVRANNEIVVDRTANRVDPKRRVPIRYAHGLHLGFMRPSHRVV